jgi:hypothetical protein
VKPEPVVGLSQSQLGDEMATKGSEYKKRQEGNGTVFEVTPAQAPKFWYLVIIGAVVGLGGLLAMPGGLAFVAMGGFAFWYGWTRDLRPKATRQSATFKVTPDTIEAGGVTYRKDDIHRLLLKNSITDKELPMEIYTTNTNQQAGMAFRAQMSMVANTLNVEMGGKSTAIAGGMDETTAYGLLTDVSRIMGFK